MLRRVEPPRTPPSITDLQKPLEHFRAKTPRLRIHPLEVFLLGLACAHLIFLPWAVGSRALWAQFASLGFGVLVFTVALWPRHYTEEFSGEGDFTLYPLPKLLRFPIFWTGLALLLYVLVQALNPAYRYATDARGWWMVPLPHVRWLPSGTDVPFAIAGQWRALLVYAPAWLLACALWIGFTRRRTLQYFFTVLAANGFALAVLAVAQRLAGNGLMFWLWKSPTGGFFGSFVYKNHASAYFNMMLAVCGGMAAWHYLRSLRRLEKSNPAGLFIFFAIVIGIAILISYSRGATVLMLVFLTLAVIAILSYQVLNPQLLRQPVVMIMLVAGFGYFAYTGVKALDSGQAWEKMSQLSTDRGGTVAGRWTVTKASWDMLKDRWRLGVGAGGYRFLFPAYQKNYPNILTENGRRVYWEHAHNDWLEFPIELGLPGSLLILFSFGYLALTLVRNFFWENPLSLLVALGGLLVVAHGGIDLIFFNPAVLITWCALWPALVHWTEFEEMNLRS
jgi:O-antigen ligase